jgi:cell division protease FtsH
MWNSKQNRIVLVVSAFVIIALLIFALTRDHADLITLEYAQELLNTKQVEKVIASEKFIYLLTSAGKYKISSTQVTPEMFANTKVQVDSGSNIVLAFLILVMVLGIGTLLFRWWQKHGGRRMEFTSGMSGRADNGLVSEVQPVKSDVSFSDIGGISDVKAELEEIIDFLRNPKRYKSFGARMPRGVLLIGPPGVGKTMIAKAVAAEADVPFYYQSGASFVQIYVGMGAKRVHELFSAAKANTPSIIFIDEIDAVGKKREGNRNDEREGTLNQLLTEMDGFEGSSGIIVIAATNQIEVLDPALLRAGRFDRRIFVDLPTPKEREAIINKYLTHIPHDVKSSEIARMAVGFSGAALAALVNEAALLALRQNEIRVTRDHIYQVKDKVLFGKKRLNMLSDEEKLYFARYQAGKALVAQWFDLPFEKVVLTSESIKPPIGEQLLKHEIEAHIKVLLSGMAACDLRFGEHATNASADINRARELVVSMLDNYAMGSSIIPAPSEKTQLLDHLYEETKTLLGTKQSAIVMIERVLLDKESITKEAIKNIIDEIL